MCYCGLRLKIAREELSLVAERTAAALRSIVKGLMIPLMQLEMRITALGNQMLGELRNHSSTAHPIYEVTGHHSSRNNDFRTQIRSHISAQYENRLNTRHAGSSHRSKNRWFQRAPSNRQPRLLAHQNSLNRRRAGNQVPRTNRMSQLRSGLSQSPTCTILSRGRNLCFPFNMDIDMRLNILEALEYLSDMGMADDIFQAQRDFNENDYELLLALDENNHQHAGASSNQISSLPVYYTD